MDLTFYLCSDRPSTPLRMQTGCSGCEDRTPSVGDRPSMRVNLLLGFSLRAIPIASLHIRRKSSKREVSSSEATYLNWIAFVDLTLEYSRSLVKHPSTDKFTEPRRHIFNKELRRLCSSG